MSRMPGQKNSATRRYKTAQVRVPAPRDSGIISAAMTATTATPLPSVNRQFVLAARPVGMPKESDFRLVEAPIPALASGQFLIRTLFLSVDPYMRGRMTGIRTYADPVDIGQLMVGGTVGKVLQSQNPKFQAGDIVVGYWGWQEYSISDGRGLQKLDSSR